MGRQNRYENGKTGNKISGDMKPENCVNKKTQLSEWGEDVIAVKGASGQRKLMSGGKATEKTVKK